MDVEVAFQILERLDDGLGSEIDGADDDVAGTASADEDLHRCLAVEVDAEIDDRSAMLEAERGSVAPTAGEV